MTALPTPGSPDVWGQELNDWLLVSHGSDGTLLHDAVKAAYPGYIHAVFSRSGALTAVAGTGRFPVMVAATIVAVRIAVGTAPTGASIICDLNINGATAFTTQANRPSIAAGTNKSGAAVPDIVAVVAGDLLSMDVDQIGSTVAGSDWAGVVLMEP